MLSLPLHLIANNNISFPEPIQFPFYYVHRESFVPGIPDRLAAFLITNTVYWVVSIVYHFLDISGWKWLEKYRIQDSEEEKSRNLVTKGKVVRTVAIQQCLQTVFGICCFVVLSPEDGTFSNHAKDLREMAEKITRWVIWFMGEQRGQVFVDKYGSSLTYNMYWWFIPIIQYLIALCVIPVTVPFFPLLTHCCCMVSS